MSTLSRAAKCGRSRGSISRCMQVNKQSEKRNKDPCRPPVPVKKTFVASAHGKTWDDPYHWLSNPSDPAVRKHLQLENAYTDSVMSSTTALQSQLQEEMASRIVGDEVSPPEPWGCWLYYVKVPEGKDYPVYMRKKQTSGDQSLLQRLKRRVVKFLDKEEDFEVEEQKLLDMNELVKGHGFIHLGVCKVSRDHRLLAYTVDFCGKEVFSLYVTDIASGALLSKPIKDVVNVEWAQDGRTLLYTMADEMLRPCRVFKHALKSWESDSLIHEEKNPQHFVDISRTKDWEYFTININSKTSSEVFLLDAAGCSRKGLQLVAGRRPGVQYFVEHHQGNLILLTNMGTLGMDGCINNEYKLFLCPIHDLSLENWKLVLLEEDGSVIYDMDIFEKHLILYQRKAGLPQISGLDLPFSAGEQTKKLRPQVLSLPKGVTSISPGLNQEFNSVILRLSVSSPIMPEALLDYDLLTHEYVVLQQDNIPIDEEFTSKMSSSREPTHQARESNANTMKSEACRGASCGSSPFILDLSGSYACEHLRVPASDMVEIPLTVVYSHKHRVKGMNPALLCSYGAYGEILEVKWCSDCLSLLDRGWVMAFSHVRGGGELGKTWHDSGRLLDKQNSMHDLTACAEFLVKGGYAHRDLLAAKGISAGGLLVAAASNMRPDLFRGVILKVPFLDIVNTMLDESLSLTVPDYEEWGNPDTKDVFDCIYSYSPYDNVKKNTRYPDMLVLSSFADQRVGYWEAAKWVARVREYSNSFDDRVVLLKTDMQGGHFADSGRYSHMLDTAFEYAFLLRMVERDIKTS